MRLRKPCIGPVCVPLLKRTTVGMGSESLCKCFPRRWSAWAQPSICYRIAELQAGDGQSQRQTTLPACCHASGAGYQVLWRPGSPAAQVLSKIHLLIQPPGLSARQHLCLGGGGSLQPLLHLCWFSCTSHSCSPRLPTSGSLCQPCPCSSLPHYLCVTKSPGSLALLANVNLLV